MCHGIRGSMRESFARPKPAGPASLRVRFPQVDPYATLLSAARGSRRRAVRLRASALGARFGGS